MANVKRNQLSSLQVKHLTQPGSYTDGGGLMLKVHKTGGRQWLLRLTIDGKRRNMGLGGYPRRWTCRGPTTGPGSAGGNPGRARPHRRA